jgi:hypothetical protein
MMQRHRTLWAGQDRSVEHLVRSALATLLLLRGEERPIYLSAPTFIDAPLFANTFGQYDGLFPALADQPQIGLGDVVRELGARGKVRLMTQRSDASEAFLATHLQGAAGVETVLASAPHPEVGLLTPSLFLSGALRFSPEGLQVGEDVLTYVVASSSAGEEAIARAYLEFDRRWKRLRGQE